MADVHSPQVRSRNMSKIKGTNTKPEMIVRRHLFSKGFRYRKNDVRLPGKPDIVLPKYKTVIFVNGCFWHKHNGCKYFVWPKSNPEFWKSKIEGNVDRDILNHQLLRDAGWNVIVVWECELKKDIREQTLERLVEILFNANETRGEKETNHEAKNR